MFNLRRYLIKLRIRKSEEYGNESDCCYICLESKNTTKLKCKHRVHEDCVKLQIQYINLPGSHILQKHGQCGICGRWVSSKYLGVENKAILKDFKRYVSLWANEKNRVYRCYICCKLFHEKKAACVDDHDLYNVPSVESIRCGNCKNSCLIHGDDFLQYKCRFCCSDATFHCGTGNHMCAECHETQQVKPCVGKLGGCSGNHLPNGKSSECLGCTVCLSLSRQRSRVSLAFCEM